VNRRTNVRTLAVVVVVLVAVLGLGVAGVLADQAGPSLDLPPVSPSSLVASVLRTAESGRPVSGTVSTHMELGLPEVPTNGSSDPTGVGGLLGDQRFRVWHSSDGVRIAQMLPYAERVLVGGASGLWTWNSDTAVAVHTPIDAAAVSSATGKLPGSLGDPVSLAGRLLDAASREADVSMVAPAEVAGRAAYVLRLTPISTTTKIGSVEVAVDAATRVPLRVEVFARSIAAPAVNVGFTSVNFGPIDTSMFEFSPPPGTTVRQGSPQPAPSDGAGSAEAAGNGAPQVRVFGRGFDLVVAAPVGNPGSLRSFLPFDGPLGSAELVEAQGSGETWILAGAVEPKALDAVAARLP
jgi:outer membrane lipoprotein-sorting protein